MFIVVVIVVVVGVDWYVAFFVVSMRVDVGVAGVCSPFPTPIFLFVIIHTRTLDCLSECLYFVRRYYQYVVRITTPHISHPTVCIHSIRCSLSIYVIHIPCDVCMHHASQHASYAHNKHSSTYRNPRIYVRDQCLVEYAGRFGYGRGCVGYGGKRRRNGEYEGVQHTMAHFWTVTCVLSCACACFFIFLCGRWYFNTFVFWSNPLVCWVVSMLLLFVLLLLLFLLLLVLLLLLLLLVFCLYCRCRCRCCCCFDCRCCYLSLARLLSYPLLVDANCVTVVVVVVVDVVVCGVVVVVIAVVVVCFCRYC